MKLHFVKGKGSKLDLQVALGLKNTIVDIESDKICEK